MNRFIIGRYLPTNSPVHRLDARGKLLLGLYFVVILFLANNWQTYLLLSVFTLATVLATKIPIFIFLRGMKPLLQIIIFTVILQIFFVRGGAVLFRLGPLVLTENGLMNGGVIFLRFLLMIVMGSVVTFTTKPIDLMEAVEYLLKPLKIFRVPVQDIALMLSIALRFIPTLMDEAAKIMNAQRARGVEFGEGNLFEQMKSIVPVFLPLFVGSFYRAEEMANAMDARGYQGGEGRSKFKIQKWQLRDGIFFATYILLSVALFTLRK